jgi:hypothetical protein
MKIDQDMNKMTRPELDHLRDKIKLMPCILCQADPYCFREFKVGENYAFVSLCKDHQAVGLDVLKSALEIEMATTMTPAGKKTLR